MRAKRSKMVTFNSMITPSDGKTRREVRKVVFKIRESDATVENVNLILHSLLMPTELSARGFEKGQLSGYGEGGKGKVSLHNWGRGFTAYKFLLAFWLSGEW